MNSVSKVLTFILTIVICCSLTGCASSDYKKAQGYMANGEYEKARALFEQLGDYEDSQSLLEECQYLKAKELFDSGADKATAVMIMQSLGGYKDSACYQALQTYSNKNYGEEIIHYEYDNNGNLIKRNYIQPTFSTTTTYEYDDNQRLTQTINTTNNGSVITDYKYDEKGNLIEETCGKNSVKNTYDDDGNLLNSEKNIYYSSIDTVDYKYNDKGLKTSETAKIYFYNIYTGEVNKEQYDALNQITYEYNSDGNLITQERRFYSSTITDYYKITYEYNSNGKLIREEYEPDSGRGSSEQYSYYDSGEMHSKDYESGGLKISHLYYYDKYGMISGDIWVEDDGASMKFYGSIYDSFGNVIEEGNMITPKSFGNIIDERKMLLKEDDVLKRGDVYSYQYEYFYISE